MSKRILSFFPINSASGKMESLEDFFWLQTNDLEIVWFAFFGRSNN